jgi:hypothetical protein
VGSRTFTSNVNVVSLSQISSVFGGGPRLEPGASVDVSIAMDAGVADDTAVTITNTNSAVLSAPTSLVIPAGGSFATFSVLGVTTGTASLTISANGSSQAVSFTVATGPTVNFNIIPAPKVGQPSNMTVTLDTIVASDTVVTLSQTNPAALTLPASLTIPSGRSSASAVVTGVIAGANITTVTATLGASMQSSPITVLP